MIIEALLVTFVVLIGSAFLLGGGLLIKGVAQHLWARWGAFFAALDSRRWLTTSGKVTRAVVTYTTTRRTRIYSPAVRYTYSVGGATFVSERFGFGLVEGSDAARAVVERFPAGGEVEVYYDPDKPNRATLDRSIPEVLGPTLGWLLIVLLGCSVMLPIGVTIVKGAFEDPPNLGSDVPSLTAQLGGVGAALGALLVLVVGVRAIRGKERRQRRLLRGLEAAKLTLVRELRAGDPVIISGRAEDLPDESAIALPFEDAPLVYYDADAEWFRRTSFGVFAVRDASGVVLVEVGATESTLLQRRRLRIEGEVERWLDETRDESDDAVSAQAEWLRFECIRKVDRVLVLGHTEQEDDELIFRARAGDPSSLLVVDGSQEEIVERIGKRIGRTRLLFLVGGVLVVAGTVAMMAPG